ncbi:unnamed protein product, partial [Chrysoparadoxa australica]
MRTELFHVVGQLLRTWVWQLPRLQVVSGMGMGGPTGTETDWLEYEFGEGVSGSDGGRIRLVDMDGDGDLDVLVLWRDAPELRWYRNEDGSGFTGTTAYTTIPESCGTIYLYEVADLDGDGSLDIVFMCGESDLEVILQGPSGDPEWGDTGQLDVSGTLNEHIISLAVADVNNDGKLDILVATDSNNKSLYACHQVGLSAIHLVKHD